MATQYRFRIIGSPIENDARCQRCDSVDIGNFSIARTWKWLGDREPPNTPHHRFENFQKYAKSDERGLYLTARGGVWRLEPDFLPCLVEQKLRPPYGKWPLSVTQKYNKVDGSDSEVEILCQACRRRKRGQVERENRKLGKVSTSVRKRILNRDNYRCISCGESGDGLQIDHIISVAEGGDSSLDNLQALCRGCHVQKTFQEETRLGGPRRPWTRLWLSRIESLSPHGNFKVEARPGSVAGRECISFVFLHRKPGLSYEITPSVPIPYGLEGFRDLALYRHGSEPGDLVFCKSARNTMKGMMELRGFIAEYPSWAAILTSE